MLNHLLAQLARHGLFDLRVTANGDVDVGWHHLVEDLGILLGRAFREAVGEGRGITRMGHAYVPLDEALALVVVDFGGRGYAVIDADMDDSDLGGLPADLIRHFLESLAREGGFNLHVRILAGVNNPPQGRGNLQGVGTGRQGGAHPRPQAGGRSPQHQGHHLLTPAPSRGAPTRSCSLR